MTGRARVNRVPETPFQRVVDDLSGGCGCACHTGTGYRTSCEHCQPHATGSRVTHGRHCSCTPCRAQDWSDPGLAPCGMHPDGCPPDPNATRDRAAVAIIEPLDRMKARTQREAEVEADDLGI